ncbi:MAG: hypothetical protein K9K88_02500 [Desulfobacterales bacterium]|nr:hypothetical protein [Desulfobacterales bacterium]
MKAVKLAVVGGLAVSVCLLFWAGTPAVRSAQQENHCFSCHTNPRKLIEITREIARANQDKPGASIQTEGEG